MRKIIKKIICCVLALAITVGSLWYVGRVLLLKRSDGITTMLNFYAQEKNTVDVLFLGSSHAGMNLAPETLWQEYGVSSYVLWGSVQPFWNSYHFLIEALKTQTPKVIVLDVYAAARSMEYSDESRQVTNTAGMRLSWNKWNAIKASAPQERWLNLLFGFPIFHQRYAELTREDFIHFPWSEEQATQKGASWRYGEGSFAVEDVTQLEEVTPLHPKQEKYLRKIIEYCKDKTIPLVLVTTPTVARSLEQPYYNAVAQIAEEYGITYYNFNLMDSETGFTSECYWTDGDHLSTKGARFVTKYLGNLLCESFDLEDHRGDTAYQSWEENATYVQNNYLRSITDMEDYFGELSRDGRSVFLIKNSSWESTDNFLRLASCLSKIGVNYEEFLLSHGGDWLITNTVDGKFINQYFGEMYSCFEFDSQIFSADFQSGTGISMNGRTLYVLNGPGVICLVYDTKTNTCVDIVEFRLETDFSLKHMTVK